MEEVSVFHQRLNDEGSDIYILIGGLNSNNPVELLNNYVSRIVGYSSYSEFIDKHMDNPYIRVIITNISALEFNEQQCI